RCDTCEEALWGDGTCRGGDRVHRASHIDEVFLGPLAGMIGPRTGVCEGVERGVEGDQSGDLSARLVVKFLEGNLADDLVAEIAPSPGGRGCHHQGQGQCEADKVADLLRVAHGTILPCECGRPKAGRTLVPTAASGQSVDALTAVHDPGASAWTFRGMSSFSLC